ncbi:MAG: hypothetical protein GY799_02320 [Desulfobulbaceae bacterium]|nr:hypothetical protein [Desulfobulbaceae bacterium]
MFSDIEKILTEPTARTIARQLVRNGVSEKEINASHIMPMYAQLNQLPEQPDFQAISSIHLQDETGHNNLDPVWGVIVETRSHQMLEFVINNVVHLLGIPIQLYHGINNLDFIMSTDIGRLVNEGAVHLTQLNINQLNYNVYNGMFLSPAFWDCMLGRQKILVFQTDALICKDSDYSIDDFLLYDYIGSKWSMRRPIGINIEGGSGGLSIRDWKVSRECLTRFPPRHWPGGEDGYFAFHMDLIGKNVGREDWCAKFGTQEQFLQKSFGVHKITCLNEADMARLLNYCPEANAMLNASQSVACQNEVY